MPAVIDVPEVVVYEEHDLYEEQPKARTAHPGFWHTVVQYMRRHRTHTLQSTPSSSCVALAKMEAPVDMLARQYPTLYIQAFASV